MLGVRRFTRGRAATPLHLDLLDHPLLENRLAQTDRAHAIVAATPDKNRQTIAPALPISLVGFGAAVE
jgi:hypothetical protein